MKKRILSLLVSAVMLCGFFYVFPAMAEEPVATWDVSKKAGVDSVSVSLVVDESDNTKYNLIVSGSGNMADYSGTQYIPWYSYADNIVKIIINEGITSTGLRNFTKCAITSIHFPSTLTLVGESSFYNCKQLSEITGGENITKCNQYAFQSTAFPEFPFTNHKSLTTLGTGVFEYSTFTEVTLPEKLSSVGRLALGSKIENIYVNENNTSLSSVDGVLFNKEKTILKLYPVGRAEESYVIPEGTVSIGGYSFDTAVLKKVTVSEGVETIGHSAFANMKNLEEVVIPSTVNTISGYIFLNCTALKSLTVKGLDSKFDSNTFYNTSKSVVIKGHTISTAYDFANRNNSPFESICEYEDCADTDCGICRAVRTAPGHQFTDETDLKCNVCDFERKLTLKITFDSNGGNCDTAYLETIGGKLAALPVAKRDGYNFSGWFDAAEGGNEITTQTIFDTDKTVYARWSAIPADTPNVTTGENLELKAGEIDENALISVLTDLDTSIYDVEYQWYQGSSSTDFNGIAIDGAVLPEFKIPSDLKAGNFYFYCVITATRKDNGEKASATSGMIKIVVEGAGGTAPSAGEGFVIDFLSETIDVSDGYLAFLDIDGLIPLEDGEKVSPGGTIYIKMQDGALLTGNGIPARPILTGVSVTGETVKNKGDGKITGLTGAMLVKTGNGGFAPVGSSELAGLEAGTEVSVMLAPTANSFGSEPVAFTVDASPVTLGVEFELNGGEGAAPANQSAFGYGDMLSGVPAPTRSGYKFLGWSASGSASDIWNFSEDGITDNMILTAVWLSENITDIIRVVFDETEKANEYLISLESSDGIKAINRFMSSELAFILEPADEKYALNAEICPLDDVNLIEFTEEDIKAYEFNVDGRKVPSFSGSKIPFAKVVIGGYGKGSFRINGSFDNIVNAATLTDNIVESYTADGEKLLLDISDYFDFDIREPQRKVNVNIAFNNSITKGNTADYNKMTVKLTGANGEVHIGKLGSGDEDGVKYADGDTLVTFSFNVTAGYRYNVEITGDGYRTAYYNTLIESEKTDAVELDFWNNVKDDEEFIEDGKKTSASKITFLAGDIVKDNIINIYDLSAVVSYFGEEELSKDNNPGYAKYDLNRDGKIDSKDVAYVLVSWGN